MTDEVQSSSADGPSVAAETLLGRQVSRRTVLRGAGAGVVLLASASALDACSSHLKAGSTSSSTAPPSVVWSPSPTATVLYGTAWYGIYYAPTPTIIVRGNTGGSGTIGKAVGATSWHVLDIAGRVVASGTCAVTDTDLTICRSGVWVGGRTVVPGHYTIACNNGVTGAVVVCPANSNLYVPNPNGEVLSGDGEDYRAPSAWIGSSPDRDSYSIQDTTALSKIVHHLANDPYFTGPQDPARPHRVWIASLAQAKSPTQNPQPSTWGAMATALVNARHAGAWYECPTNEPENGGWSTAATIAYWRACAHAILAADPTAHVMGFASGGIYNNSPSSAVTKFLETTPTPAVFTEHMENSHQNLSNIVALRQHFNGIKAAMVAAGFPKADLRLSETGINGGSYGVLQPRREARQRTLLRFVAESYGWAKENHYDFPIGDHHGSGLATYLIDCRNSIHLGSIRAGAYALHVMAEALHGTTCTPASPPAKLSFGATGSAGDSLLAGLHYKGTTRDVVVLATNGVESGTVTLKVSATGSITYWDGMGVPGRLTVTNGQITVPVNDLLTYVFLPTGSTVSPVRWWDGLTNLLAGKTLTNESSASVTLPGFAANKQGGGTPGSVAPYVSNNLPATLSVTTTKAAQGFALMTSGPAWQRAGCSVKAFKIEVNGSLIYSYECASAVSVHVPSPSYGNSADICPLTTWWTGPFGFFVKVLIPAGRVKLTITDVSYGGQPDSQASLNPYHASHEGDPQQVQLADFQLLG